MPQAILIPLVVIAFPVGFGALWLGITWLLGRISGWSTLERAFPDHPEEPVEILRYQWGWMRGVNYNNSLRFEICATGLRVSVIRLLGPFQKPFFVPWGQIRAERKKALFTTLVALTFGMRAEGGMTIRERAFERIAAIGNLRMD